MIGKNQFQLSGEQLASGQSSTDYTSDGVLGNASFGLNPFVVPGAMYSLAGPTDLSTNVVGNIIASAPAIGATYIRTFVDDAGNYYTTTGSATTKQATATTNAAYYTYGTTDMVSFGGNTYVTTQTDIDLWEPASLTLTNSWWVGTKSQTALTAGVRHPMVVFNNYLYVADNNRLHNIAFASPGTGASINSLANTPFVPSGYLVITALGIDPMSGLMMIAVQEDGNYSNSKFLKSYVYMYDGVSALPTRIVPVDDQITAFYNVEGTLYVASGLNLGVWNGLGVTFLRKMLNAVAGTSGDVLYKHHFANSNKILHVVDGANVLSYGAVTSGKKGFFYTAWNQTDTNHITALVPLGPMVLGIAYKTTVGSVYTLKSFDFNSTSAGVGEFYTNKIYFPRPVFIRRQRIFTTGITTTSGIGSVAFLDDNGNIFAVAGTAQDFVVPSEGAPTTGSGSPQYYFDFDYSGAKTQTYVPRIAFSGQGFGITRIITYYDVAE